MMLLLCAFEAEYKCFSTNSTVQAVVETKEVLLFLYPASEEQADCAKQHNVQAQAELIFPADVLAALSEIKLVSVGDYTYKYGEIMKISFTCSSDADFFDIIERAEASYILYLDEKTISIRSSVTILNHLEFNSEGCWSNVVMEYDLWSDQQYVQVNVEPNQCDVSSQVDAYLYYNDKYGDFAKVPILANNSLENGLHSSYDHLSTKIFEQYYSQYGTDSQKKQFQYFAENFLADKQFDLFLIVEYQKRDSAGRAYTIKLETQLEEFTTAASDKVTEAALYCRPSELLVSYSGESVSGSGGSLAEYSSFQLQLLLAAESNIMAFMVLDGAIEEFTSSFYEVVSHNNESLFTAGALFDTYLFLQFFDGDGSVKNELTAKAEPRFSCIERMYAELTSRGFLIKTLLFEGYARCEKLPEGEFVLSVSAYKKKGDPASKICYFRYKSSILLEDQGVYEFLKASEASREQDGEVSTMSYSDRIHAILGAIQQKEQIELSLESASELVVLSNCSIDNYLTVYMMFSLFAILTVLVIICIMVYMFKTSRW